MIYFEIVFVYFCLRPGHAGGHGLSYLAYLQVLSIIMWGGCGCGPAAQTRALERPPRNELLAYIELTLFIRFDLERKVDKPPPRSASVNRTLRALGTESRFRFVCFYGRSNTVTMNMVEVKINDDVKVGGRNPCFIIAEVGQNHQGDIEIAKKLMKAAKDAGANCVKFQKTCLNEKFTKKYLEKPYDNPNSWGKTYGEHKRHLEFSESQYRELFKYAHEIGILCTASAMDMVSFDFLVNNKAPFIKIGSGDSNNLLFLKYAASKKVPLIISTGMVDKSAVKTIYDIISATHKNFCLLHCISAYPVPYEDCNLTVIQDYMNTFDIPIGYSGQEVGTAVALASVALGAKVLEKHITLEKTMKGTDHVCSLTPTEFQQLVRDVRVIENALGTPIKKVVTSEIPCIDKLQKSLVMGCTKNKGEILYPGDVKIKVAEPKGLNALHFEEVIYKTLVYDKKEDEPLNQGDFC